MDRQGRLSNVTKDYLSSFYCILDTMIQGMTEAELTDSISYNFIVRMIPHHHAAIEMSENILQYTTNVSLQEIALQIIEEQTKSIADMEAAKCSCERMCNLERDVFQYQRRVDGIMQNMFYSMEHARVSNQINADFMWEMIPHHRGAVELSETTLQYDICPALKPILDAIIVSQKRGISQMQRLLRCIGH